MKIQWWGKFGLIVLSYLLAAGLGYLAHPTRRDTGPEILMNEKSFYAALLSRIYLQMENDSPAEARDSLAFYLATSLVQLEEMKSKCPSASREHIGRVVGSIAIGLRSTEFVAHISQEEPALFKALPAELKAPT